MQCNECTAATAIPDLATGSHSWVVRTPPSPRWIRHQVPRDHPVQPDQGEEWDEEEDDDGCEEVQLRPKTVGQCETRVLNGSVNVSKRLVLRYRQNGAAKNKVSNFKKSYEGLT